MAPRFSIISSRDFFTTASSMIRMLRSAANYSIPFTTIPRAKEGMRSKRPFASGVH